MLQVKNLYKKYDEKIILDGINIQFNNKNITSILGKSGEGKTTLFRIITGLESLDSGEILTDSGDQIGMVFQDNQLYPHLSVMKNLVLPQNIILGVNKKNAKKHALNILKKLGIDDLVNSYPGRLSGGEQQRVAIARALVMNMNILLLDEPTSALDSSNTKKLVNLLLDLKMEGQTIIIITHDEEFAKIISDEIYTLENGKITEL